MDMEVVRRIITDQKEEVSKKFEKERIIERRGLERNERFISHPFIFITTGIRRCGKSIYSLLLVRDRRYGYVNFDDERFKPMKAEDLDKVLEALFSVYGNDVDHIVLDEIQNIEGWELFANRLQRTYRVVLTGSNARLLSKELGTHLTGRYVKFRLFPFSFREYLDFIDLEPDIYLTSSISIIKDHLKEYMRVGGIPDSYRFGGSYLLTLVNDIIERDIINRYRIRYVKEMHEIARYLMSNYSRENSYNKITNISKIGSVNTVKNYVHYLENSYLVFELHRYSNKLKEQTLAPRKIYCIDPGIISAFTFNVSEDIGLLMENMVAVELMRRMSLEDDLELYYWKNYQQHEVDFVLRSKGRITELIQVTHAGSEYDLRDREVRSLRIAGKNLSCDRLTVITSDLEMEKDGMGYVPLWKWLLK
ncbi:MAG: ATP-binding protein [Candidatus Thermoplasmatota archaeon]|nr:ATP-binding protein [Candidatus Thermoplasmatota archaeon]